VRTPVCDLLGIEHPIVQAPKSAESQLAAAVSEPLASQARCVLPVEPWLVRDLLQEQRQALRRRS
jgi:hypothetical protein